MLRLSLLWGFALMLMPALLIQGWWVRKRAIRMGPADGPSRGFARKRVIKAEREMVRPYRARRPISRSSYWALEIVSSRVSGLPPPNQP